MCAESIAKDDFHQFRHRWEMPMIWLSFALTVIIFLFAAGFFAADQTGQLEGVISNESRAFLNDNLLIFLLLPIAPLFFYAMRFFAAAQSRANSVLVGPKQFPDLYALYHDLGERLDMDRLPKLYVSNGNGVVNAFALECNRRHKYVVVNAEIAMLLPTQPDIVAFVLAHELAHHKLRHVSLWRIVIGVVPRLMVLPGQATTRAQEYSADRVALAVLPETADAMRLLAVGPWMAQGVDPEVWLEQCEAEHREFWVRVIQSLSSHAVMVKRFKALRDIERDGFQAQGEMF